MRSSPHVTAAASRRLLAAAALALAGRAAGAQRLPPHSPRVSRIPAEVALVRADPPLPPQEAAALTMFVRSRESQLRVCYVEMTLAFVAPSRPWRRRPAPDAGPFRLWGTDGW